MYYPYLISRITMQRLLLWFCRVMAQRRRKIISTFRPHKCSNRKLCNRRSQTNSWPSCSKQIKPLQIFSNRLQRARNPQLEIYPLVVHYTPLKVRSEVNQGHFLPKISRWEADRSLKILQKKLKRLLFLSKRAKKLKRYQIVKTWLMLCSIETTWQLWFESKYSFNRQISTKRGRRGSKTIKIYCKYTRITSKINIYRVALLPIKTKLLWIWILLRTLWLKVHTLFTDDNLNRACNLAGQINKGNSSIRWFLSQAFGQQTRRNKTSRHLWDILARVKWAQEKNIKMWPKNPKKSQICLISTKTAKICLKTKLGRFRR